MIHGCSKLVSSMNQTLRKGLELEKRDWTRCKQWFCSLCICDAPGIPCLVIPKAAFNRVSPKGAPVNQTWSRLCLFFSPEAFYLKICLSLLIIPICLSITMESTAGILKSLLPFSRNGLRQGWHSSLSSHTWNSKGSTR